MDPNLAFDYIPICATILSAIVAFFTIVYNLRLRWPINVNCWFCHNNNKIFKSESDWWKCSYCDQYNGFDKDGDYKYDIPAQRSTKSTAKFYCYSAKREPISQKDSLCSNCIQNEELKLCELRSIDPDKWRDTEINNFRRDLDEKYPLCKNCDSFVAKVLRKQSVWLTQYKMLIFKKLPVNIFVNKSKKLEILCRMLLVILSFYIIYYPNMQVLSIMGILLQLTVVTQVPKDKQDFHLILTFLWMVMGMFIPFNQSKILQFNLVSSLLTVTHITGYQIIVVLASVIGFLNLISRSPKVTHANVSFKKLDSPEIHKFTYKNLNDFDSDDSIKDIKPSLNDFDANLNLSSSQDVEISKPRTDANKCSPKKDLFPKFNSSPELMIKPLPIKSFDSKKYSLNDSLQTLSLSLAENDKQQLPKSPKVFETKAYGTLSPDLFKTNFKPINRKFILAPPKLKSATQTSWVAGGYWQTGIDTPTLSRSSSQSSGFGSTSSNFGPSREPSVVNDVDKCSVISDQFYNAQRQNSISPVNSSYQHGSSFRLAGPDYNHCQSISNCNSQQNFCHSCHMTDQCLQNHNINCNIVQRNPEVTTICSTQKQQQQPTTILTNSIMMLVLVGGSLLFNIISFCINLLR